MIQMLMICENPLDNWIHNGFYPTREELRASCRALWEEGVYSKPLYAVVIKPKWNR